MNRRIIQRVVVFLVLFISGGAIVNVAVAWGCCSSRVQLHSRQIREVTTHETRVLREYNLIPADVIRYNQPGFQAWELAGVGRKVSTYFPTHAPKLMNYYTADFASRTSAGLPVTTVEGWAAEGSQERSWKLVWPGFAINTIFYAAILWLMFAFPFALRRRRRIKRGQCPSCAYPVGRSAVCTECGKPSARSTEDENH